MHNTNQPRMRPFLKWAGNKYRLLDQILKILPPSNRLIEPFLGSGAVFLNSTYRSYLLGERNQDLIGLYNYIKQGGPQFIHYCSKWFSGQYNNPSSFYLLRELFNQLNFTRKRAALFLYLNRHGYNGLCRYNNRGEFNVPFGRYVKPYFPLKEMNYFYHRCQHHVEFFQGDFRNMFAKAIAGDIIYCDPPYVPLSKSANFSAYTNKLFTLDDQIALANLAKAYASNNIPVIISNHDTEFTREHYKDATLISFPVKRLISCKSHQRDPVQEILAIFN